MAPQTNCFDENELCNIKYSGLDTRKAYTDDFMDIEQYPVYMIVLIFGKSMITMQLRITINI
jgi:hypothetical protein